MSEKITVITEIVDVIVCGGGLLDRNNIFWKLPNSQWKWTGKRAVLDHNDKIDWLERVKEPKKKLAGEDADYSETFLTDNPLNRVLTFE